MRTLIQHAQKLLTRLLMAVLVLVMLVIVARMFTQHVLVNRLAMDNTLTRTILGSQAEAQRADQQAAPAAPAPAQGPGLIGKLRTLQYEVSQSAGRITAVIDDHANQRLPYRAALVEAANEYEDQINWNLAGINEYNSAVDQEDGYLTTYSNWIDVWENAHQVALFRDTLIPQGIPLLFVQYPNKISKDDTVLNNVVDFYNSNADRLLEGLRHYGVDVLDLRQQITAQGKDYQALFYDTDHHWRPETGLWAAGAIARSLRDDYGIAYDLQLLEPSRFTTTTYERWFLGSQGKKLTLARAVPDDFTLLTPEYPVDWTLKIPSIGLDERGGFDIIYDMSQVEPKDLYGKDPYGAYMHAGRDDQALMQFRNYLVPFQNQRILLIGDSFSNTMFPFLALGAEHIDKVDLRHYEGSLPELISSSQYTMVVIAYSSLFQVELNSGKSMYDFR